MAGVKKGFIQSSLTKTYEHVLSELGTKILFLESQYFVKLMVLATSTILLNNS